jgi:hypothetical protein
MKIKSDKESYYFSKLDCSLNFYDISILLILVILISSCSEKRKNSLESSNLKGAIKSITSSTHDAYEVFGEPNHESSIRQFTFVWKSKYNRDGYLIESNAYDPTGFYGQDSVLSKTKYQYDTKGNEIERRTYDRSGKLTAIWEFFYDEMGNSTGSSSCEFAKKNDVNSGTKVTEYCDDKGQIIKSEIQKCDGELIMTIEYKYDEFGNAVEEKTMFPSSQPTIKYFKYDINKKLIEEVSENMTLTYRYELDSAGNWIKQYEYKNDEIQKVQIREIEYYN